MNSRFVNLVQDRRVILTEGAIVERLRREMGIPLHPVLENAPCVFSHDSAAALERIYREYIEIGIRHGLPVINFTPTWRASFERIERSEFADRDINAECVQFLRNIHASYADVSRDLFIGGLMGCRGDAYNPDESLSEREARDFHRPQARALTEAGVDFLCAETLPAIDEAAGMAAALAEQDIPYVISFVLGPDGRILDGSPLPEAVRWIDSTVARPPLFYMANCCHPSFLEAAFQNAGPGSPLRTRVFGMQANASRMDAWKLDNAPELDAESPDDLAEDLLRLHTRYGASILGGCCGTNAAHLESLARRLAGCSGPLTGGDLREA
ncbi:homocysteine S-methyltransferase family protein [bacterium]|nr:homocysteine S-methyltransferase family protein [bacterium]